ncbi:M23 family metallopeptidase [Streptomyces sp. NPDC004732]|uniref:murein hydrolase activator EnvC family protein n=1 Tax=Streptomyces sp. NPDC004732 TaxID=3154290 RepID=UPI0033BD1E23
MRPELLLPTLAALLVTFLPPAPAPASTWPVGTRPPVVRGWSPPATAYGAGHRGVDLTAEPGAAVRAVAPGRISFAGPVAGRGVVVVELDGTGDPPLRTTYEPVRATVKKGAEVAAGAPVGFLERPTGHCPTSCLHWGLRRAETYLNPMTLLPPWLQHHGPSRLLPTQGPLRPPPYAYGREWYVHERGLYAYGRGLSPGLPAAPWPRLPP